MPKISRIFVHYDRGVVRINIYRRRWIGGVLKGEPVCRKREIESPSMNRLAKACRMRINKGQGEVVPWEDGWTYIA